MRPVNTDAIKAEIRQLEQRKQQLDDQLEELDQLEDRLPDLEAKRTRLTDEIKEPRDELETAEEELEAIDSNRIAALVEYFESYVPYLVVALLEEDAQALEGDHEIISEI